MTLRNALFLLLLLTPAVPMCADEFRFSYQFVTGNTVSGTVDGDLQSDHNTVLNLRNLAATYSATPDVIFKFLTPGQTLKLDGIGLDFSGFELNVLGANYQDFGFDFLYLSVDHCSNCAQVGNFIASSGFILNPANPQEVEDFNPTRWSAAAIPEPSMLALCGVALLGLRTWIRKR